MEDWGGEVVRPQLPRSLAAAVRAKLGLVRRHFQNSEPRFPFQISEPDLELKGADPSCCGCGLGMLAAGGGVRPLAYAVTW